jgi:hypothetical protein
MKATGNQHRSRKAAMHDRLDSIRVHLDCKMITRAQRLLSEWWLDYFDVPASTRRRWRAGR